MQENTTNLGGPLSGLYIPPESDTKRLMATSAPQFTELAAAIDPWEMPPGDSHRKFCKKPARERDPERDGVTIGIGSARTCTIQLAPQGVWWFRGPLLVVRNWDTESEGRGPMVVRDFRKREILTADSPEDLLRTAGERDLKVSAHRYLPRYERAVLKIAQARGIWDGIALPGGVDQLY